MSLLHRSVIISSVAAILLTGLGAAADAAPRATKPVITKPTKPTKPTKAGKPAVRFATTGSVSAVDATTRMLTVTVKGGKLKVQSTAATVVLTAKIVRNDAPATLDDLRMGDKVNVVGVRTGGVLMADGVRASGPVDSVAPTP